MSNYPKVPAKWRKRILAFNRQRAADSAAAADMHKLAAAISLLPPGQLQHLLTEDVLTILARYGVEVTE